MAVEMQTDKLYLETSDDLRTIELALLGFVFLCCAFFFAVLFSFRSVN